MDWRTEFFGDSIAETVTFDGYQLRTPGGRPGSCRFYSLTPNAALRVVVLPFGGYDANGESVVVHNADGANTIGVVDKAAALVGFITAGQVATFYKTATSVAGSWLMRASTASVGTGLVWAREPLNLVIGNDEVDFNLRSYWDARGYTGDTAAALRVWVGDSSYSYLMGASSTSECGFDSGEWPSGSTLLLFNYGVISGKGGAGGRGGDVPPGLLAQDGSVGGPAMRLRINTVIVNYGTIQGGGGGGGGASWQSTTPGSGGGGGAGHTFSLGGEPGTGIGGSAGSPGSVYGPGAGGANILSGRSGGTPGAQGEGANSDPTFVGAVGGAGGASILRLPAVTVTKIRTGTILGTETTF